MTKAQQDRVAAALAWAQKRLGTSYTLMISPVPQAERGDCADILLMVCRTHRGPDDANAFSVFYNPDQLDSVSTGNLRIAAGHELIHCVLWPLSEMAETGSKERKARAREANETATYQLMRCIFGEMK